ncbi:MAG: hypothetical protein KJO41_07515 [Bacteroidia bacterium]|nr:hypothetical protein [Bacteroidia bacterium]MBT8278834.1 hypothetical protein [Bacteroidia bacterium]NND26635.1 hypothetical protein [Flavobacteriaceae bacterium]NNK60720.1 hypothetical protein [Flavobacteriaceae bacterium]
MKKLLLLLLGLALGIAICYLFINPKDTKEALAKPPAGVITPSEAKTLDAAFNSRHQLISDSIVKRPDNRSSWYSLQDMRDYLSYAEGQARDLGYTMDGVRIYLGAHANEGNQVGYTTMFLVPTGTKKVSEGGMITINMQDSGDIPGGSGFNNGGNGYPPNANYPNN